MVEGGKDPDDVLRDQGAAALKAQLAKTEPFVERLFKTALEEAGPLETPEQKTAFKVRLRRQASTIADAELASAYREDLLGRFEALWPVAQPVYTVGAAARELSRRRWSGRKGVPPITGATGEGKAAAQALHASPRPLSAALALEAIRRPDVLHDSLERVALSGFGDEALQLIAGELVTLSLEGEVLDEASVRRRLAARGVDESVFDQLSRAAARAQAAFMAPDIPPAQARQLWTRAFDALMELESLERAVEAAKKDVDRDGDFATLIRLKADRDGLARAIGAGEIWDKSATH
jgi:DNA primase